MIEALSILVCCSNPIFQNVLKILDYARKNPPESSPKILGQSGSAQSFHKTVHSVSSSQSFAKY
ncbi:hypothetical protein VCHA50P415_20051 [Vibrio chagasii]|nr:hypothetical protein VCHA50P415_20051 [Vibrio chagasii]CAH7194185.1 hypothetical protein VCHA40O231_30050 [Vibrio chagasii]CAH7423537.1 hypothetical protein VCHA57P526_30456 [Vibrio chagasii]